MLFPVQKPLSPVYVTPCRRHLVTGPDSFTSDNTVIKHSGPALPKLRSDPNTFLPMSSLTLHMTVLLWCILSRKNDNSSRFLKISGLRHSHSLDWFGGCSLSTGCAGRGRLATLSCPLPCSNLKSM